MSIVRINKWDSSRFNKIIKEFQMKLINQKGDCIVFTLNEYGNDKKQLSIDIRFFTPHTIPDDNEKDIVWITTEELEAAGEILKEFQSNLEKTNVNTIDVDVKREGYNWNQIDAVYRVEKKKEDEFIVKA